MDEFEAQQGQRSHTAVGKMETQRPGFTSATCLWGLLIGSSVLAQWGCVSIPWSLGWDSTRPAAMEGGIQPEVSGSESPCLTGP